MSSKCLTEYTVAASCERKTKHNLEAKGRGAQRETMAGERQQQASARRKARIHKRPQRPAKGRLEECGHSSPHLDGLRQLPTIPTGRRGGESSTAPRKASRAQDKPRETSLLLRRRQMARATTTQRAATVRAVRFKVHSNKFPGASE